MSEQPEQDRNHTEAEAGSVVRTGHPAVDQVLASLEGLEDRAVEEHAAVFEAAHDALRSALSDVGQATESTSG